MTRHLAKLAAVYLLLGLVATWAAAWGCVLASERGSHPSSRLVHITADGSDFSTVCVEQTSPGMVRRGYGLLTSTSGGDVREVTVAARDWPAWSLGKPSDKPVLAATAQASGWPWLSLQCRSLSSDSGWSPRRGIGLSSSGGGRTALPLVPLWPGLIANTLFFAAVFLGLHHLVGFTKGWRRRRRGRCAGCGYDLSGIEGACPECGRTSISSSISAQVVLDPDTESPLVVIDQSDNPISGAILD